MSVLLIAEHNNKEVKPFTRNAITAASQIDQDLHVLVIGKNVDEVIDHMANNGYLAGIKYSDNQLLIAVTEKRTKKEIDKYVELLNEVINV